MTLTRIEAVVGGFFALVGGLICGILGGWDVILKVLVTMVVLDYISGLLAAFVEKKLNSEVGFKGVAKKALIFVVVALAVCIDQVIGKELVRYVIICFYIGTEGLSVLKNVGRAGLSWPAFLLDALEEIQKKGKPDGKDLP
ncbi:MAG: phage holin family protein [Eubacteriales bacterium]